MYRNLKHRRLFIWAFVTIAYMAVLLQLSLRLPAHLAISKSAYNAFHIPAYFVFAFLLANTCRAYSHRVNFRVFAFCGSVIFGGAIEITQIFVSGRSASLNDLILNAIGAGSLVLLMRRKPVIQ